MIFKVICKSNLTFVILLVVSTYVPVSKDVSRYILSRRDVSRYILTKRDVCRYILTKRDVCRYNPEDQFNSIHKPRFSLLDFKSLPVLLEREPNEEVFMLNTGL